MSPTSSEREERDPTHLQMDKMKSAMRKGEKKT